MKIYSDEFFSRRRGSVLRSARIVVPQILELVPAESVVDVGCGTGEWLAEFQKSALSVFGLDGTQVPREQLQIAPQDFQVQDLERSFDLGRRFDLVLCLEVAEHLPAEAADGFVASLVKLAPVVVFSAAIPFQPGTGHVNLQWPSYWSRSFASHGYVPIDALRRRLWAVRELPTWYRQNMLIYAAREQLRQGTPLYEEYLRTDVRQLDLVHPDVYLKKAWPSVKRTWKLLRARLRARLRLVSLRRRGRSQR